MCEGCCDKVGSALTDATPPREEEKAVDKNVSDRDSRISQSMLQRKKIKTQSFTSVNSLSDQGKIRNITIVYSVSMLQTSP